MGKNVLTTGLLAKVSPAVIYDLNNGQGTFLYNHNINEVMVIEDEDGGVEVTTDEEAATGYMFMYDSVRVEWPKTANNITQTLLEAKYPQDIQQKLVNDYQAAQLGILEDDEAEAAVASYRAFLADRKSLKAMVDSDCEDNGIPQDI